MSGLRNKAIRDETRKFGYPSVRLKSPAEEVWYGGEMEAHIDATSRYHQARPAGCFKDASSDRARQPRHSSGTISARSGERSRAALVAPSLQSFLRGGCSAPGRHCAYPRDFAQAISTMDRHLSAAVASSASLCASDGLLTGWIRPQLGGSAFGLSEGPGSQ